MNDLKFAFRQLVKNPGFTAVAVLTLALGIGANQAIFNLLDAIVLRSLPVREPGQLFFVTTGGSVSGLSYATVEHLQRDAAEVGPVFAYRSTKVRLNTPNQTDVTINQLVSGNYFTSLGLSAVAGRTLSAEDDRSEAPPAAVISYGCWERRFGRSATVLGQPIRLNGTAFTTALRADDRGQPCIPHRVRQRCEPPPCARHVAPTRDRGAPRRRCEPMAVAAPAADGERGPCHTRRVPRPFAGKMERAQPAYVPARRGHRCRNQSGQRSSSARLHGGHLAPGDTCVWSGAGVARHTSAADRSDERGQTKCRRHNFFATARTNARGCASGVFAGVADWGGVVRA